jgi:dimeric dUTPase (all-alpha-NTP-PPase superfamily)
MYKNMCEEYLFLGELLGFSSAQIEKAYVSKNEVNHERQKQGY